MLRPEGVVKIADFDKNWGRYEINLWGKHFKSCKMTPLKLNIEE